MRYTSDIENAKDTIQLEKEAEYVHRFSGNFHASFSCTQEVMNWKIIPFLLIAVAENIFKHGVITDSNYPAKLSVHQGVKKETQYMLKSRSVFSGPARFTPNPNYH